MLPMVRLAGALEGLLLEGATDHGRPDTVPVRRAAGRIASSSHRQPEAPVLGGGRLEFR